MSPIALAGLLVLGKKRLERVADGSISIEAEVWPSKWMLRFENRVLAWQVTFHLRCGQSARVVLIERKGTIQEADDVHSTV
jgi:hypothetical protein